jgi:hypothetical protein
VTYEFYFLQFQFERDICEPLPKLTLKDTEYCWLVNHDNALDDIKRLVTSEPVLKQYDPKLELQAEYCIFVAVG